MVSVKDFTLLLSGFATALATNIITFVNQDSIDRDVVWTPSSGYGSIPTTSSPAGQSVTVVVPQGWIGNFYAVPKGSPNVPGMLGEVAFQGWHDLTYFDISAIVNPHDKSNVKQLWPKVFGSPKSGCDTFPCDNAYYLPDDIQTKTTTETELICVLGNAGPASPPAQAPAPIPVTPLTQLTTPSVPDEVPAILNTVPALQDAASPPVAVETTQQDSAKVPVPSSPAPAPPPVVHTEFLESVRGRSYPPPIVKRNRQL